MHKLVMLATAAVAAAAPAIAHADHDLSRPVRLAEVSADPRDGADTIALRGLGGFTHLELRAREAFVDLHGIGLRMRDGRVEWLDARARIAPGQQRTIELPLDARRADAVVVDYGDPESRRRDRTPARLEIYGSSQGDCDDDLGAVSYPGREQERERARMYRDIRPSPAGRDGRDGRDGRELYRRSSHRTLPVGGAWR